MENLNLTKHKKHIKKEGIVEKGEISPNKTDEPTYTQRGD